MIKTTEEENKEKKIQDEEIPKENKLRKYDWNKLILELIVVFLGVSSGFFLNNWQIEKQEKKLEQQYISAFLIDIDENIKELERVINDDSLWIKRAKPLLYSMYGDSLNPDSAGSIMKLVTQSSRINAQAGTYEDITNSGNLNLINDFNLKRNIIDYYIEIEGVRFLEEFFNDYLNIQVLPFILSDFSILKENFIDPNSINSNRFSNSFAGYYGLMQQRVDAYVKLLDKAILLKEELIKNGSN